MKFTSSLFKKFAEYDNSTLQIIYEDGVSQGILDFVKEIDENDVSVEEGSGKKETNPHITVLYGIRERTPDELDLASLSLPKKVEWEGLGKFANEETPYDVLIIKIKRDTELQALFDYVNKVYPDNDNSFPDYIPHTTIAYVKKGQADKYIQKFGDIFIGPQHIKAIQFAFNTNKWDYDPNTGGLK